MTALLRVSFFVFVFVAGWCFRDHARYSVFLVIAAAWCRGSIVRRENSEAFHKYLIKRNHKV